MRSRERIQREETSAEKATPQETSVNNQQKRRLIMNTHAFNLDDRHELLTQLFELALSITRDPVAARSVASRVQRDFRRERKAPGTEKVWDAVPEITGGMGVEAWLIHEVRDLCLDYLEVGPHPDDKRDPEVAGVTDDDWSFFAFMYGDEADDDDDEDDSLEEDTCDQAA
jgi:hypothetical protein